MPYEKLASAENILKGNLASAWNILEGTSGDYTDLGIARRFGGATAAYSLRDIGAMNGRVVKVRRNNDSQEEDFSANQIEAGVLENFCNNVLTVGTAVNGTGSFPYGSFTANGNTGFSADNSGGSTASAGFPYTFKTGDIMTVTYTVSNFTSDSGLSPAIRGTTGTGSTTQVAGGGTTFTANGTYTDTLTATADGTHLMYADGNTGSYTISNFAVTSHKTDGFVTKWYDQSGNGRDASQTTPASQPFIVQNGAQVKLQSLPSVNFAGRGSSSARGLVTNYDISSEGNLTEYSIYAAFDNNSLTPRASLFTAGDPINGSTSYGGFDIFVNSSGGRLEINHQEHGTSTITTVRPVDDFNSGDTYRILTVNYNSSSLLSKLINVTSDSNAENTSPQKPVARDGNATAQYLKIGAAYTFQYTDSWQGFISEIIMFEKDIRSDNDDIVSDLTSFYGQPSSTP